MVFALGAVTASAEEPAAEPKAQDPVESLHRDVRELQGKMAEKQKQHMQDPEIKELQAAIEKKAGEVEAARDALRAKIGEKDPEAKALLEQRGTLTHQMAEAREQLKKLQEQTKQLEKALPELTQKLAARERAHQKDPDLKEQMDAIKAREQELDQARKAPMAKMMEKDADFKALMEKRDGLQKQIQDIRASRKPAQPEGKKNREKGTAGGAAGGNPPAAP